MEKNGKIDNLFRKKIPAGETTPPEDVWESISTRLSKKEKRRGIVIPLWYRIAGIAAVLLVIFSLAQQWDRPGADSPNSNDSTVETKPENTNSYAEEEVLKESDEPGMEVRSTPGTAVTENKAVDELTRKPGAKYISDAENKVRPMVSSTEITFDKKQRKSFMPVVDAGKIDLLKLELAVSTFNEPVVSNDEKTEEPAGKVEADKSFKNRFSVSPVVAAVYFGKIGGGNAMDDRLSGNSNSGEITAAYGISLGYGITEKLKIRSGFNNVSLNSNTRNVDNVEAINAKAIDMDPAASFGIPAGIGDLNQHLRFLEIPLELEYTLVDRRFGITLITGASTFLLEKNEITLNSTGFKEGLGPANNLNSTSFSANLGFGLKYRFATKFHFNLAPLFKYQFNMYRDVEDLQPYHFGIYSGIRFNF